MVPKTPTIPPYLNTVFIAQICQEEHFGYWIESEYKYIGYIEYPDGKRCFFKNGNPNMNPLGSVELCRDKDYTAKILQKFHFSIPEGRVFFSDSLNEKMERKKTKEDALIYAQKLGYPLIIKPNNLSQGDGVFKVYDEDDFIEALHHIHTLSHSFRVEKFYPGRDYRIVVVGESIISAYERIPLTIVGNGQKTIQGLLYEKQEYLKQNGRNEVIHINDKRILLNLRRNNQSLKTILQKGERLKVLDNANLSTGGEGKDMTNTIHKDFQEIALHATKSLGLKICGVDIITTDISKSLGENHNTYTILELNGEPGLDNYLGSRLANF